MGLTEDPGPLRIRQVGRKSGQDSFKKRNHTKGKN